MLEVVVGNVPFELAIAGNHAMAGATLYTNQTIVLLLCSGSVTYLVYFQIISSWT